MSPQQVTLWFKTSFKAMVCQFTKAIIDAGFIQSKADYTLFTHSTRKSFTTLLIYVDDIVIIGNNIGAIKSLKYFLHTHFLIKDLEI